MENLYETNGLLFWTEEEIMIREMLEKFFVSRITRRLKEANSAFEIIRCEAPLLTPRSMINPNYTVADIYATDASENGLVLRPETTMGSFAYAKHLLNPHNARKVRMPLVVWQHGKSFRREDDQPTKFMRLKEFHQLEFQIVYGKTTMNDYFTNVLGEAGRMIYDMIGQIDVEPSDRLPSYSERTEDIICKKTKMEVCSVSKRTDFPDANVVEVAIGTDRVVHNFQLKNLKD